MRKEGKVKDEKDDGQWIGFYLVDIGFDRIPYIL
jgi:hypothetical protein